MSTNRVALRRPARGELSSNGELELWLGIGRNGSSDFADDDERREAWRRHRGRLLDLFGRGGRRPVGWWMFDAPALGLSWPGDDTEQSYLYEHGQLSEAEAAALLEFWREQWDRSRERGFGYCAGPGEWLKGRAARTAHCEWADIPRSLVEQWTRERRKNVRAAEPRRAPHATANR